jgi:hypothetical protein
MTIQSPVHAESLVAEHVEAMAALLGVVEQETALVRSGRLRDAAALEPVKSERAQHYAKLAQLMKAAAPQIAALAPAVREDLRRRQDECQAILQANLTVLATAHAVSEGIMRGVSEELQRKTAPQTYGASGRPTAPGASAMQPLTVSRVL